MVHWAVTPSSYVALIAWNLILLHDCFKNKLGRSKLTVIEPSAFYTFVCRNNGFSRCWYSHGKCKLFVFA